MAYADKDQESSGPTIQTYVNPRLLEQESVDDIELDEFEAQEDLWFNLRSNLDEFRESIYEDFDNDSRYGSNSNRVMSHVLAQDLNGMVCDLESTYKDYGFTIGNVLPQEKRSDATFKQSVEDDFAGNSDFKRNNPVATSSEAPEIVLSDERAEVIQKKIDAFSGWSGLGFVFLDLDTGNYISYNVDEPIYGASSFKGPYCTYICDHLIDEDVYHLDENISDSSSSYLFDTLGLNEEELFSGSLLQAVNTAVDSTIAEVGERQQAKMRSEGNFNNSDILRNSITAVVRDSDNDQYRSLKYAYSQYGFNEYLDSIGVDSAYFATQWSFPTYSARTSALLWLNTYHYLFNRDQSETAAWLADLYATTNLSFIRAGVGQADVQAYVMNKAGWIAGDVNSTSDAALIEVGNKTYLMSIMTGQPDSLDSEQKVAELACALIEARDALDSRG